jgi:hypothetical protein
LGACDQDLAGDWRHFYRPVCSAGKPSDTAARKTPQHRIFQQPGGILGSDLLSAKLTANGSISTSRSPAGANRCTGRVGMIATNDAIMRATLFSS